jgi:hypothetical protein
MDMEAPRNAKKGAYGGCRRAATSEMTRRIHPLMKDTDDPDLVSSHHEIDDMRPTAQPPKAGANPFAGDGPKWIFDDRPYRSVQRHRIGFGLVLTPTLFTIDPDSFQIGQRLPG